MYVPIDLTFGFDADYYRSRYSDLTGMSDEEALSHFIKHGHYEGRFPNRVAGREGLFEQIPRDGLVLEIGPFGAPQIFGPHVRYADFLSTEELRERAPHHGHDPDKCPAIHYVLRSMGLSDITERFSAVFSSHCIEHQPDLVKHLRDVGTILRPGGRYFLAIPDKRYCFDHFAPASNLRQVISAHRAARQLHSLRSILTAHTLQSHNDPGMHWAGDHGKPRFKTSGFKAVRTAISVYRHSIREQEYVDVHAWQFTPERFNAICTRLHENGLSPLRVVSVCAPLRNRNEFCAILERD